MCENNDLKVNEDVVTMNEVLNTEQGIYFYQDKSIGGWVAYGYSAYLLSQIDGMNHLASFSERMQMPCVCIADVDFRKLVKENAKSIICKDGWYYLPMKKTVDTGDYNNWVKKVR